MMPKPATVTIQCSAPCPNNGRFAARDDQFGTGLDKLSQLVQGLADRRGDISTGLAYINAAAGSVADLLGTAREPIKETVTQTKTQDGTPVAYVQASDHIEIRDMGDIASVESVVTSFMGGEYRRFVDPQITAGISGARINMTGIDTNKLAHAYQANGQGTLLGQSDLEVHMTNGKTVRVFLGTGM